MKKIYEKPAAYIERFDLTQSIAAGCTVEDTYGGSKAQYGDLQHCGIIFNGSTYFSDSLASICPDGEYSEFCYNAPMEGAILFAS